MIKQDLDITVVILTFNEELHLERCLSSLQKIATRIVIVDSYSTDLTETIAKKYKADFYQNAWSQNYANQLNWALENCNIQSSWTMRMDADEYLSDALIDEIQKSFSNNAETFNSVEIPRSVIFKGKKIRYGGWGKIPLLRIWKTGLGKCEERWMDEHIVVDHPNIITLNHTIIDENLNSIHWWTLKHNNYAKREATDYLINKYNLDLQDELTNSNKSATLKRKIKDNYYNKSPLFLRSFVYFFYRYFFKLGFLDGKRGLIWHFLQGCWYRFLVDVMIFEIEIKCQYDSNLIKNYIKSNWSL